MSDTRTILITGVSREEGIGFGLAGALARQGHRVLISARKAGRAEELAQKLGENVTGYVLDITEETSVRAAIAQIQSEHGRLDTLINNAAGGLDFGIHPMESDLNTVRDTFETNLFGAWSVIRACYPLLKNSDHPRIVNISSSAGSFTEPQFGLSVHPAIFTAYGLSKLALNGLTVKFARQFKEEGILINAVCPGFVATAPGMADMGARTVTEAMDGIIWAATLPDDGPTGGFFRDRRPLDW